MHATPSDLAATVSIMTDVWPDHIPAAEYPRAVRLLALLKAAPPGAVLAVASSEVGDEPKPPPRTTPSARPQAAARQVARRPAAEGRKPGRPPKGTPPLREEVAEHLRIGPRTAAELAEAVGSPVASIYLALKDVGAEPAGEGKFALPGALPASNDAGAGL